MNANHALTSTKRSTLAPRSACSRNSKSCDRLTAARGHRLTDIFFCIADHFEPAMAGPDARGRARRVAAWVEELSRASRSNSPTRRSSAAAHVLLPRGGLPGGAPRPARRAVPPRVWRRRSAPSPRPGYVRARADTPGNGSQTLLHRKHGCFARRRDGAVTMASSTATGRSTMPGRTAGGAASTTRSPSSARAGAMPISPCRPPRPVPDTNRQQHLLRDRRPLRARSHDFGAIPVWVSYLAPANALLILQGPLAFELRRVECGRCCRDSKTAHSTNRPRALAHCRSFRGVAQCRRCS